mmetsp:Transcript_15106/g.62823  ORF Transcript_15106/g.62823 Transcript_15106/m.62823 type:complete len:237 (+) Transcript_15106:102-812(+)
MKELLPAAKDGKDHCDRRTDSTGHVEDGRPRPVSHVQDGAGEFYADHSRERASGVGETHQHAGVPRSNVHVIDGKAATSDCGRTDRHRNHKCSRRRVSDVWHGGQSERRKRKARTVDVLACSSHRVPSRDERIGQQPTHRRANGHDEVRAGARELVACEPYTQGLLKVRRLPRHEHVYEVVIAEVVHNDGPYSRRPKHGSPGDGPASHHDARPLRARPAVGRWRRGWERVALNTPG